MRYVKIDEIIVPENRQRKSFDDSALASLANSIASRGLLHPITVRNASTELVAGERRLRAIAELARKGVQITCNGTPVPRGCVPVIELGDLDQLALEETELEENIIRADLTWQERANAEARLHALRCKQAEEVGEKQTLAATAAEINGVPEERVSGIRRESLRESILLNNFLDDPDVAAAPTRREALSLVKKKLASEFRAALAKSYDTAATKHSAVCGDACQILPTLPAATFDIILTDPPYGINAHSMAPLSGSNSATQHTYDDSLEAAMRVWQAIFVEGFRVTRPTATLYMFCDFRHWSTLIDMARAAGWDPWPTPVIWHKPSGGMLGNTTRGPRKSYELILLALKGDVVTTGCYNDVISMAPADSDLHAAAKPVDLYVELLRRYAVPGQRVLDPCMGSGTIFPAANRLFMTATGIEVVEEHYNTAITRLSEDVQ